MPSPPAGLREPASVYHRAGAADGKPLHLHPFHQTYAAETAESKALNRTDSDSMLAVVARDLEQSCRTPWTSPACISTKMRRWCMLTRSLICSPSIHQQVSEYQSLYSNGVITHETLLTVLKSW